MASKTIDCCGLSCPEPVIQARKAMQETGLNQVNVRVNATVARDNIARAARQMGWQVEVEPRGEEFLLTLTRS